MKFELYVHTREKFFVQKYRATCASLAALMDIGVRQHRVSEETRAKVIPTAKQTTEFIDGIPLAAAHWSHWSHPS
jgi:hypothetical protein